MNSPLNSFQLGSPGPCRGTRCLLLLQGLCEWQLYPLPLSFLAEAALGGQKQVSEHSPPPPKAACQLFSREHFGGKQGSDGRLNQTPGSCSRSLCRSLQLQHMRHRPLLLIILSFKMRGEGWVNEIRSIKFKLFNVLIFLKGTSIRLLSSFISVNN